MDNLKYSMRNQSIKEINQKRKPKEVTSKGCIEIKCMPESGNNFAVRNLVHLIQVIK
jgi:hypothetical protein